MKSSIGWLDLLQCEYNNRVIKTLAEQVSSLFHMQPLYKSC